MGASPTIPPIIALRPLSLLNSIGADRLHCTTTASDTPAESASSSTLHGLANAVVFNDKVLRLEPINRLALPALNPRGEKYEV